jgi:hypothetical protein
VVQSRYEVAETYEEVFPRSRLLRFRRFIVWLFPAWFGVLRFNVAVEKIKTHYP